MFNCKNIKLNESLFFLKTYSVGLYRYVLIFNEKSQLIGGANKEGCGILEHLAKGNVLKNDLLGTKEKDFIFSLFQKDIIVSGVPSVAKNWIDPQKWFSIFKNPRAEKFVKIFYPYLSSIFYPGSPVFDTYSIFSHNIKKYLPADTSNRILDIGCGSGSYSNRLHKMGFRVVALDIVTDRIEESLKKKIAVIKGEAEDLPFNDDEFDFVICLFVLEHVANIETSVKEMVRVIKPGSRFLIAVPTVPLNFFIHDIKKRVHLDLEHFRSFSILPFSYSWRLSIFSLIKLIKRSGARIVRIEGIDIFNSLDNSRWKKKLRFLINKRYNTVFPFKYIGEQAIMVCEK